MTFFSPSVLYSCNLDHLIFDIKRRMTMTNVFWKIQHEAPSSVQMVFNQTDLWFSASHMAISQFWNISVATSMTGTIVYRIQSALAIWKSQRLRKKMHNLLASHLLTTLFTTKSRTFCLRITYPWMDIRVYIIYQKWMEICKTGKLLAIKKGHSTSSLHVMAHP